MPSATRKPRKRGWRGNIDRHYPHGPGRRHVSVAIL
jgi:hypothetical protein